MFHFWSWTQRISLSNLIISRIIIFWIFRFFVANKSKWFLSRRFLWLIGCLGQRANDYLAFSFHSLQGYLIQNDNNPPLGPFMSKHSTALFNPASLILILRWIARKLIGKPPGPNLSTARRELGRTWPFHRKLGNFNVTASCTALT